MKATAILVTTLLVSSSVFGRLIPDPKFNPKVSVPTFTSNHPNICFDQGHLNLGPGDGRHDPVLKLLESDGYRITILKTAINTKTLDDCQIFYVSSTMATNEEESGFTPAEIGFIKSWVERGGSLLLMTDHPKMLAMAPEKLANAFGVFGSMQTVEDPSHTITGLNDPTVIAFSEKEMNRKSSIIQGRNKSERLKKVIAFTGQSLRGPPNSESVLSYSENAVESFKDQPKKSAKGLSAMLALKVGQGRVVVTGDGTFFSSKLENEKNEKYGINRTGTDNVQMALNTFHWLSNILN